MESQEMKISLLRKYIYEYALLALTSCVIYLFFSINGLNNYIRDNLTQHHTEATKIIQENTLTIREFINYQKSLK